MEQQVDPPLVILKQLSDFPGKSQDIEQEELVQPPREQELEQPSQQQTTDPLLRRSTRQRMMTKQAMESLQQSEMVFNTEFYN
eukprot:1547529-Ditylum_brightwellii.AAC.2